jgi:hypothetical protein
LFGDPHKHISVLNGQVVELLTSKPGATNRKSNKDIIQRFQNEVFRSIVNAPWYVRNSDLHRDLEVDAVSSEIQRLAQKHEERLHHHENVEAIQNLDNMGIVRRLQTKKPFELV